MAGNLVLSLLLRADASQFKQGVGQARVALNRLVGEAETSGRSLKTAIGNLGGNLRNLGTTLSVGVSAPLGGLGAAMINTAANFEAAMNSVKALSLDAPAEQIAALKAKARQLGETTKFSATESANAIEILLRNGQDTEAILGGALEASLDLAAATGASLPRAADVITDAMAQFRLEAGDLDEVVTQIVGTVNSSKFAFEDYAQALAQGGGTAGAVIEFDEFNATLAAVAANFQSGSDAGTALKTFLTSLAPDTKAARDTMAALGISFTDAAGEIRPMAEIVAELSQKFAGLSEEQQLLAGTDIFGQDALRALLGLVQTGPEQFDALSEAIAGTDVKLQQAARQQGLSAELTKLRSALEGLSIAVADTGILDFATRLAQGATELARKFTELDPALQKIIAIVGGGAAVAGPLVLGLGLLAGAITALLSPIGLVVGAMTVVGGGLAGAIYANQEAIENALIGAMNALKEKFEAAVAWVADLGQSFIDLKDSVIESASGMVEDIEGWFGGKLQDAADLASGAAGRVAEAFGLMEKEVTGQSYVPDMVDAIEGHFGRLEGAMVAPGEEATTILTEAFDGLGRDVGRAIGDMVKEGEASLASFADFVDRIAERIIDNLIEMTIVQPASQGIGNFFGSFFGPSAAAAGGGNVPVSAGNANFVPAGFAQGGAFDTAGIVPFAQGGAFTNSIVNRQTVFPLCQRHRRHGRGRARGNHAAHPPAGRRSRSPGRGRRSADGTGPGRDQHHRPAPGRCTAGGGQRATGPGRPAHRRADHQGRDAAVARARRDGSAHVAAFRDPAQCALMVRADAELARITAAICSRAGLQRGAARVDGGDRHVRGAHRCAAPLHRRRARHPLPYSCQYRPARHAGNVLQRRFEGRFTRLRLGASGDPGASQLPHAPAALFGRARRLDLPGRSRAIGAALMPRAVSSTFKAGLLAGATAEGAIALLTITHASLPAPIRLSSDRVDTTSRGETYQAFPFELVLPDDREEQPPRAEMRFSNVSREITAWLRSLPTAPEITIELVRLDDPESVEASWSGLRLEEPRFTLTEVALTLSGGDKGTRRFPAGRFNPGNFPGLYP